MRTATFHIEAEEGAGPEVTIRSTQTEHLGGFDGILYDMKMFLNALGFGVDRLVAVYDTDAFGRIEHGSDDEDGPYIHSETEE